MQEITALLKEELLHQNKPIISGKGTSHTVWLQDNYAGGGEGKQRVQMKSRGLRSTFPQNTVLTHGKVH